MTTVDDAVEAGARALWRASDVADHEWAMTSALAAAWPILSAGLRELHSAQWECGNPRHTNPDVGCPECCEVCVACDRDMPCATVRELDRIDKELGNE